MPELRSLPLYFKIISRDGPRCARTSHWGGPSITLANRRLSRPFWLVVLLETSFLRPTKPKRPFRADSLGMRRERDSNPRTCYSQRFSRPPQSTTLPSLRRKGKPKSFFEDYKTAKGPFRAYEQRSGVTKGRLYRIGGLGHRARGQVQKAQDQEDGRKEQPTGQGHPHTCLLYTSDAADE